jgi:hypothetical protein
MASNYLSSLPSTHFLNEPEKKFKDRRERRLESEGRQYEQKLQSMPPPAPYPQLPLPVPGAAPPQPIPLTHRLLSFIGIRNPIPVDPIVATLQARLQTEMKQEIEFRYRMEELGKIVVVTPRSWPIQPPGAPGTDYETHHQDLAKYNDPVWQKGTVQFAGEWKDFEQWCEKNNIPLQSILERLREVYIVPDDIGSAHPQMPETREPWFKKVFNMYSKRNEIRSVIDTYNHREEWLAADAAIRERRRIPKVFQVFEMAVLLHTDAKQRVENTQRLLTSIQQQQ